MSITGAALSTQRSPPFEEETTAMQALGCFTLMAVATATAGAITDARTGLIPNWLTMGSLLAAPAFAFGAAAASGPMSAALDAAGTSLLGAVASAVIPVVLFARGSLGGGDVKLFAAIGAWLGARVGIDVQFFSFVAAAVFIPGRLAWDGKLLRVAVALLRLLKNPLLPKSERAAMPDELRGNMRLGPAILAGTLLAAVTRSIA